MDIEHIRPEIEPSLPSEKLPKVDESPKTYGDVFRPRNNLTWDHQSGFHSGPHRRKTYQVAMWSLAASVIDGLLLLGMNFIFMIAFIKIVKMPITRNMGFDFSLIFLFASWMYMITTRFFLGCSIGEAACDLRLGKPQDRNSALYFLKVLVRASLVTSTGLVVFPLLSLLTGKDLAGRISGAQLFSLR